VIGETARGRSARDLDATPGQEPRGTSILSFTEHSMPSANDTLGVLAPDELILYTW
jgi:hypothetical protein